MPWDDRIELDVWYVEHRSPWLDLKIIARTPRALFAGHVQGRDGRLVEMIPFFNGAQVREAVSPERALEAVREAFIAYARGEWTMPPKVYVPAYPEGDFRAMPALGGGHALLKWVTSFPGQSGAGLADGDRARAPLRRDERDAEGGARRGRGDVAAHRCGRGAGRGDARPCRRGDGGGDRSRRERRGGRADVHRARPPCRSCGTSTGRAPSRSPSESGPKLRPGREEALAADLLVTVTPGRQVVLEEGSLRPGQHASLMGADGPGKAEIAVEELARVRVFCDDWEQASHNGDLVHAVEAGVLARDDVSQLGDVLIGTAEGRKSDDDITVFDSTGLAIQDLAIALAALERRRRARPAGDSSLDQNLLGGVFPIPVERRSSAGW